MLKLVISLKNWNFSCCEKKVRPYYLLIPSSPINVHYTYWTIIRWSLIFEIGNLEAPQGKLQSSKNHIFTKWNSEIRGQTYQLQIKKVISKSVSEKIPIGVLLLIRYQGSIWAKKISTKKIFFITVSPHWADTSEYLLSLKSIVT